MKPPGHYFRAVVIVTLLVLFLMFESAVVALTSAVLVIFVPPATVALICTTSVIVAVAPDATAPNVTVRLLPVPPHTPPPVAPQETKVTCAGRLSVTATAVMNYTSTSIAIAIAGVIALRAGATSAQVTVDVENKYSNVGAIMVWGGKRERWGTRLPAP